MFFDFCLSLVRRQQRDREREREKILIVESLVEDKRKRNDRILFLLSKTWDSISSIQVSFSRSSRQNLPYCRNRRVSASN